MSRSRDLANLANNATGLETLTVSDITDLTATATELNYVDGVNSAVQTQLTQLDSQTSPHIIPGVLYPAVAGKLLDGTTSHSGNYGTAQTQTGGDGRSYYYTDIKGSKPIKDPRIGGYFGSQRHKFKSIQLLEQETTTHGKSVYSIDGREWVRAVDNIGTGNDDSGNYCRLLDTNSFIEIVGYFSDFNWSHYTASNRTVRFTIDGGTENSTDYGSATVASPLNSRYVDTHSLINIPISQSLGIHTIKIRRTGGGNEDFNGCELIAQDKFTDATCDYNNDPTITHDANTRIVAGLSVSGTGIPANATVASITSSTEFELSVATTGGAVTNGTLTFGASNIQIPSQDVVSYGKKFTVSGTPHYDPFNGFTNGTSLHSAFVDTATSLGLDTAPGSSAKWAISSTNNVRPYNGGRVVKWVDSSGVIKTSVNMMPPNAQNIASSVAGTTEVTTPSATNTTPTPIFSDDAIDHSQAEVAKTFHFREFGNGSANGNANYADASMLTTSEDDIAYVMDDGLTSLSGDDVVVHGTVNFTPNGDNESYYITFIGTGLSLGTNDGNKHTVAQNLPYGTHIFQVNRTVDNDGNWKLDGITVKDDFTTSSPNKIFEDYGLKDDITFHQPKKPPIPEDACVLADYMLMADHVNKTSHTNGVNIGKGVRLLDCSRDIFHDTSSGSMLLNNAGIDQGYPFRNYMDSGDSAKISKVSAFGTSFGIDALASVRGKPQVNGSDVAHTDVSNHVHIDSAVTLGNNLFGWQAESGQDGGFFRFEIATPIHTSHHYQPFETPFLHELIGGDRNMEQTNLVCSSDGKTWDELTRDTSYLGPRVGLTIQADTSGSHSNDILPFTKLRGGATTGHLTDKVQKGIAYGYNRAIILENGEYELSFGNYTAADDVDVFVKLNNDEEGGQRGNGAIRNFRIDRNDDVNYLIETLPLKRGDFICIASNSPTSTSFHKAHCIMTLRKIN